MPAASIRPFKSAFVRAAAIIESVLRYSMVGFTRILLAIISLLLFILHMAIRLIFIEQ